jgi:hypothetical protein
MKMKSIVVAILALSLFSAVAQTPVNITLAKKAAYIVSFPAEAGVEYTIQSSTNMSDWMNVTSMQTTGGTVSYTDVVDDHGQGFYRVIASATTGSILVKLDTALSPPAQIVHISTTSETDLVPLAVFDVKSVGKNGTLSTMNIQVATTGTNVINMFTDIKIKAGGSTYSADLIVGSIAHFANLVIPLPQDQFLPITVYGRVARNVGNMLEGATAQVSLVASADLHNPYVMDAQFNTMPVNNSVSVGAVMTFASQAAITSNLTTSSIPLVNVSNVLSYAVGFGYTLTAADSTLYVSKNPTDAATFSVGVASVLGGYFLDNLYRETCGHSDCHIESK